MEIQSILFDKKIYTLSRAKEWLEQYDYVSSIDEKEHHFRARQREPSEFDKKSFRTKGIKLGISFILGRLKNK